MKKITLLALATATAFAVPAFAQSEVQKDAQDISSDAGALHKDNKALEKDNAELAKDRANKAADKANGNYGHQALDSMAIGADQTKIGEKKTERKADQKILDHDKKELNEDSAKQ